MMEPHKDTSPFHITTLVEADVQRSKWRYSGSPCCTDQLSMYHEADTSKLERVSSRRHVSNLSVLQVGCSTLCSFGSASNVGTTLHFNHDFRHVTTVQTVSSSMMASLYGTTHNTSTLSEALGMKANSSYVPVGFPEAIQDIVEGRSLAKCNFDIGHIVDAQAPADASVNWNAWENA
jgi:hypothetical protein